MAVSWSIYRPTPSRRSWLASPLLWWVMRRSVALPSGKPQRKSAAFPSRACWKQTRCPWSSTSGSCNVRRAPWYNGTSSTIDPSISARCGRRHTGGNARAERSHEKTRCGEGSSVHVLHCDRRRCHHNRGDDATGPLVRLLFRSLLFVRLLGTMSLPPAGDDDGKSYTRPHQGIQQQIPEPSRSAPSSHQAGEKVIALPVVGGLHHDYHWAA
jgi:hypothetical protein